MIIVVFTIDKIFHATTWICIIVMPVTNMSTELLCNEHLISTTSPIISFRYYSFSIIISIIALIIAKRV